MKRTAGFLLALLLPVSAYGSGLVNINTADAVLLDTLPGIGPTYAQRIIDYRTAHGPFAVISDIQNVSGIGPSTYATIAPFITVGEATSASSDTASSTTASPGRAETYVPPPSELALTVRGGPDAYVNVPLVLFADARAKGSIDAAAQILWSFGDGSFGTGTETRKVYHYPGTYLVTAVASDGMTKARGELVITVMPAEVSIVSVSSDGITLQNGSAGRLDLSGWRLSSDTGIFRIPEGTILLPGGEVLFPYVVTNLPFSPEPFLSYPDGSVATRYRVPVPAPQPSMPTIGSYRVQTVVAEQAPAAPAEDISISGTAHETTSGLAPAVAAPVAAAGAALTPPRLPKVLTSPWTLGFLGAIVLAGGAFILL